MISFFINITQGEKHKTLTDERGPLTVLCSASHANCHSRNWVSKFRIKSSFFVCLFLVLESDVLLWPLLAAAGQKLVLRTVLKRTDRLLILLGPFNAGPSPEKYWWGVV